MANELSVTIGMLFAKNGIPQLGRGATAVQVTVAGNGSIYQAGLASSTTDVVIPLGSVANIRWAYFRNLDAANNIKIKGAIGGTILCTLLPGEAAAFPFDSTVTAPSFQSNAGTPLLEYEIWPA